jgi:hypothetical protein
MADGTDETLPPAHAALLAAASVLGVEHLVDENLLGAEPLRFLQLAAAVSGRADAIAMVNGSSIAAEDPTVDPAEVVDTVAFAAAGMRGSDALVTREFWALWSVRRLQCRTGRTLKEFDSVRLSAVDALLDAVHGLLSSDVHRAAGDTEIAARCDDHSRAKIDGALGLLSIETR